MPALENDKHEMFANEFVKDLNASQAAIRCGYSERSSRMQGSRLMTDDNILRRIEELKLERSERTKIDVDYVLKRATMMHEQCWDRDDAKNAIAALKLVGDHVNVQAFKQHTEISGGITVEPKGLDDFYKQGDK
jgi:phage terminase small subunit